MEALTAEHAAEVPGLVVSARSDYGMRALLVLSIAYAQDANRLVKADTIASAEGIPSKYLEGILTQLRREGLVHSHRGKDGGFRLLRAPGEITLAEAMAALHAPHERRRRSANERGRLSGCRRAPDRCVDRGAVGHAPGP